MGGCVCPERLVTTLLGSSVAANPTVVGRASSGQRDTAFCHARHAKELCARAIIRGRMDQRKVTDSGRGHSRPTHTFVGIDRTGALLVSWSGPHSWLWRSHQTYAARDPHARPIAADGKKTRRSRRPPLHPQTGRGRRMQRRFSADDGASSPERNRRSQSDPRSPPDNRSTNVLKTITDAGAEAAAAPTWSPAPAEQIMNKIVATTNKCHLNWPFTHHQDCSAAAASVLAASLKPPGAWERWFPGPVPATHLPRRAMACRECPAKVAALKCPA